MPNDSPSELKSSSPPVPSPREVEEGHPRWGEAVGVILFFVGAYLVLCLLTYSPLDPSLNSTGAGPVKNLGGPVGAYLGDILVQLLGWGGFSLPALFIFLGISRFFSRSWSGWVLRWSGAAVFLLFFCILLQLSLGTGTVIGAPGREAGGFLGYSAARLLKGLFGGTGAALFALAFFLSSLVLVTGISLRRVGVWAFVRSARLADWLVKVAVRRERHRTVEQVLVEKEKTFDQVPPVEVVNRESPRLAARRKPAQEEFPTFSRPRGKYALPPLELLAAAPPRKGKVSEEEQLMRSRILEKKLADFGVDGRVTLVRPGPVITVFEFEPAAGKKVGQVVNLTDDLSLAMGGVAVRVVGLVPGKSVVAIEVPNKAPETVFLRDIISSPAWQEAGGLPLALGKDTSGECIATDLSEMPHLLVAGATGMGKSVAINSMILSLLYALTPDEVRILMVDPKMLELSLYEGMPHLLAPVVIEPKKAAAALRWMVAEMERRYLLMLEHKVRNVDGYNRKREAELAKGGGKKAPPTDATGEPVPEPDARLPHIVVVIDELADLMMTSSREVEESIARLGQKARAAGIHLLLATQRPSVDIISGSIKNNITSRVAFKVFAKSDSRVILDVNGAEQLLGRGDMLFVRPGMPTPLRIHGSFVTEEEVQKVVRFVKTQAKPEYREDLFDIPAPGEGTEEFEDDEKFEEVKRFVFDKGYASASMIQRHFKVGYNRAARMVDRMEAEGLIGPPDGGRPRPVIRRG